MKLEDTEEITIIVRGANGAAIKATFVASGVLTSGDPDVATVMQELFAPAIEEAVRATRAQMQPPPAGFFAPPPLIEPK